MNEICEALRINSIRRSAVVLTKMVLQVSPPIALKDLPPSLRVMRRSADDIMMEEIFSGNDSELTTADQLIYESLRSTTTPAMAKDVDDVETNFQKTLANTTDMIKTYLNQNYEGFRRSSEVNAMTTIASIGLFLNFLSLLAIVLDRRTALTSRRVHASYVVAQQAFLVFVVCFLHLKKVGYYARYADLEAFNYFTVFLGLVQFLQPWMLFAVAGYVRACLENMFGIGKAPRFPLVLVATGLLFAGGMFTIYIPPVRVWLHAVTDDNSSLCEDPPVEKLWNLDKIEDKSRELVNVLVYNISYILALYLVPSVLIAYRSKGIVDLLHALQEQPKVLANSQELACTSLIVAVTCNLHLACVTIKIVVYLFYLVELFFNFVADAFVFFQYLSVFANLLIITGTGCHVFILMRYNRTVQYFMLRVAYQMKLDVQWLRDSLPKWKKTKSTEIDKTETDASSQV